MPESMIEIIRRALGRSQPQASPPTPPPIPDSVARLVAKNGTLIDLFIKSAADAHFQLTRVTPAELRPELSQFLRQNQCKKVGVPASELLDRLDVPKAIEDAGATVIRWDHSTLDAAYDLDCGITDVYAAVAETGSLVIRPTPSHGRALSLVPPIHIAIVEPANVVPDLIDLFEKIAAAPRVPNITIITGPSKTADIEGALVTGVHGPGVVQAFLVDLTAAPSVGR
jgi:L-lactate dehydrogenase complex protein LldG